MQTFLASDLDYLAIKRQSKLRPGEVILINFSGAQFEANVALDDIYIAVQGIRDLVNKADTYHQTAFDSALRSLENDMSEAVSRLRKATKIIRKLLRHCGAANDGGVVSHKVDSEHGFYEAHRRAFKLLACDIHLRFP
jgi:hypothetical protein